MTGIRIKLRLDYAGYGKQTKLFGGKNLEQMAEEARQNKVSLLRNVPTQGIHIEEVDMGCEVYTIYEDIGKRMVAYAPVSITFSADSIDDAIKFSMKDEFRTVEVLEPEDITLSKYDLERLMFKVSEELMSYKEYMLNRINNWK